MNLAAAMEARTAAGGWADRPAFFVGARTFSHHEVHAGASRLASLLDRLGVGTGDRVLLAMSDGVEFAWALLGAVRVGALAVPVNPRLTADDHRYMLTDSGARVVICDGELVGRFTGATVIAAERLGQEPRAAPRHPAIEMADDAPAYAQYTSGTTGAPKAAVHRHRDPFVYFEAFAGPAIAIDPTDVVLSVSKMYFAYGLGNSLFFPLLAGASAVLIAGPPDAQLVADLVAEHGVTVLFSVPTFYARLVAAGRRDAFSSLRAAVSAGECLAPALGERAEDLLGCPVLDGLGSTEVGQTFASNTLVSRRAATVGRALPPYEVSVRDGDGQEAPAGQEGILWVRGPTVLVEYLGKPEATAAAMRGEWLCTGDRAVVDADGFVHHRGRDDDLEMVGGITVAPMEIEQRLSEHPRVSEVAVAGVRDSDGASRLEAFVVLRSAPPSSPETVASELVALAGAHLAPYKVPRAVRIVDALPRTPTGKLRRFVLRSGRWPEG